MKIIKKTEIVDDIIGGLRKEGKARFDFGTFHVKRRKKGKIINSQTGEQIKVKPYLTLSFKASNQMKNSLKGIRIKSHG